MRNAIRTITIFIFILVPFCFEALTSDEKIIGEWNDNVGIAWKLNIKIIKKGDKYFRISTFHDGSQSRAELKEMKPKSMEKRRFKDLKSANGEIYAIDNNGDLDLFDEDGFIRKAQGVAHKSKDDHRLSSTKESCFELGVRYGRCAGQSLAGYRCDPKDNISKPKNCMDDSSFDQGIKVGVSQVLQK